MTTRNPNEFDELEQILTGIATSDQPIEEISLRYLFGRFTDLYNQQVKSCEVGIGRLQTLSFDMYFQSGCTEYDYPDTNVLYNAMTEFENRYKQVKLKLYKKLGVDLDRRIKEVEK